jgi:hypothetical protein
MPVIRAVLAIRAQSLGRRYYCHRRLHAGSSSTYNELNKGELSLINRSIGTVSFLGLDLQPLGEVAEAAIYVDLRFPSSKFMHFAEITYVVRLIAFAPRRMCVIGVGF